MRIVVANSASRAYSRPIAFLATVALGGLLTFTALPSAAIACGGEVPTSCGSDADDARYLLKLAVIAVKQNEGQALSWFTNQSHGFRTEDLYVFCIGPDNIMDAHPDPKIKGVDATKLVDSKGFHFGEEMIKSAKDGRLSDITYMWPRLDGAKPYVKHTMFTRVADQICAVGYYE